MHPMPNSQTSVWFPDALATTIPRIGTPNKKKASHAVCDLFSTGRPTGRFIAK